MEYSAGLIFLFLIRSNLSKTEKKYRSAYDLDTAPKVRDTARNRSSSLHNLDEEDELSLRVSQLRVWHYYNCSF